MPAHKRLDFKSFHLCHQLLQGLEDMGYSHPTPVQALAIPEVMLGHDLLVQAKTGSGKTLAFALPLLNRLDLHRPGTQVLVLTPTRELALQVSGEVARAGRHLGLLIEAVFGGIPLKEHVTAAQWSSFLVGTPGRVRDLLERGILRLEALRVVVLDEADEMLDMGFKKDLEFILDAANARQQTLLLSATFPREILRIAKTYMRDARKIQAQPEEQSPTTIVHRAIRTTAEGRLDTLIGLLRSESPESAIVFCQTKSETPWLSRRLRSAGFEAACLNGDMSQSERFEALESYKRGDVKILVATEVAARGLDIAGVSHVIHFSVPQSPEVYLHRSGRTGRAGKSGIAITLVTPKEERLFARIARLVSSETSQRRNLVPAIPVPQRDKTATSTQLVPAGSTGRAAGDRPLGYKRSVTVPLESDKRRSAVMANPLSPPLDTADKKIARAPSIAGVAPSELVAYAGGLHEPYLALARHLLRTADPVTVLASLLAVHPLLRPAEVPSESNSIATDSVPRGRIRRR